MNHNRSHRLSRLSALALIALLAVGCTVDDPASAHDEVYEQARDLGQALSEAAAATQDASTGYADPGFAARRIERAVSESRGLTDAATKVEAAPLRDLAADLVSIADRAVMALTLGDVAQAERIRTNEFVPAASQLADLKRTLPAISAASQPSSTGSSLTVAFSIVAVIVGGIVTYLRRRADEVDSPESPRPGSATPDRWTKGTANQTRAWHAPSPLYDTPPTADAPPADDADAFRTTKVRPIDIELGELLESTLDQVKDRGWEVTLVCPAVRISGDPLRFQRAILAALGNAYLGGPSMVGIVVEEDDGQVRLSIGHDAPMDETTTEDLARRLANQLELALATLELAWSAAYDDEISLITVALGASLEAPIPATAAT